MVALLTSDPIYRLPTDRDHAPDRYPRAERRAGVERHRGVERHSRGEKHPARTIARRPRMRHLYVAPAPTFPHTPDAGLPGLGRVLPAVSPGVDAGSLGSTAGSTAKSPQSEVFWLVFVVAFAMLFVVTFRAVQSPPAALELRPASSAAVNPSAGLGESIVAVKPGDTLWGIAGRIAPSLDRREVVQRLAERNGGSAIWAGQQLVVPSSVANL